MLAVDKNVSDDDILALWNCKLFDTVSMASIFGITEHEMERKLWRARETAKGRGE